MNRFAGIALRGRVTWSAILTLAWLLVAVVRPGGAGAQIVTPEETAPEAGHAIHDYYARYTDPSTATVLQTVERYHLSDSFWRYYREGAFNSARSDLQYVLSYFPNHPTALHLIAYDMNVKSAPSAVIQRFEVAIRAFPTRAYTYAQYGRYLMSIGKRNIGVALLDDAIRLDPNLVVARAWRAEGDSTQPRLEAEPPGGAGGNREPSTRSKR